jgi:hypothetical protein
MKSAEVNQQILAIRTLQSNMAAQAHRNGTSTTEQYRAAFDYLEAAVESLKQLASKITKNNETLRGCAGVEVI